VTQTSDVRVVFVTVGDKESGLALARQVVDEGLAACANLLPGVTSVFEWDGIMREEAEILLILKTSASRAARLAERVAELHTYDVPEVLILVVEGGHEPYLDWVRECTRAESSHGQKEP
jgi:periplasmic divalent cation tolerance protein